MGVDQAARARGDGQGGGDGDAGVIDLRWLAVADVADGQWSALSSLLDEAERARAERLRPGPDRDRAPYIAAHALVRSLLAARHGSCPAAGWRFRAGPRGRPDPVMPPDAPPDRPPLRISLSHTRGLAVVAVTDAGPPGVDAEWLGRRRGAALGIARRYFTPAEVAGLEAMADESAQEEAFLALWTAKEAALKALGRGLSMALDAVEISEGPDPAHPRLRLLAQAEGSGFLPPEAGGPWLLRRWRLEASGHVVTLALPHAAPQALAVRARGVTAAEVIDGRL